MSIGASIIIQVLASVVPLPFLGVAQHGIGFTNLFEFVFVFFLLLLCGSRVSVWVVNHGSLSVCFFEVFIICTLIHIQYLVVVFSLGFFLTLAWPVATVACILHCVYHSWRPSHNPSQPPRTAPSPCRTWPFSISPWCSWGQGQ